MIDETGVEIEVRTADIYAGDIVKIREGEMFPADLVLISSSNKGQCYIETANLDGESNFKPRWSLTETSGFDNPDKCTKLKKCLVTCGPPDNELYKFLGTLNIPADLSGDLVHAQAIVESTSSTQEEPSVSAPISTPLLANAPPLPAVPEAGFQFPLTYVDIYTNLTCF
jgi:magnesium-transporting ATPase (P-type)